MADIKITELPATEESFDSDLLVLEQASGTKKIEKGDFLSDQVKSVNNELPDSSGNVEITIPDVSNKMDKVSSPTNNDILLTNSSGQAIDSGKKLTDLQNKLTAGTGIDISNNVISNQFANLPSGTDLNTIRYNYQGYAPTPTNAPSSASYNLIVVCRKDGLSGIQIASKYNDTVVYARTWYTQSDTRIWNDWKRIITEPVTLWENSSVDTTFPPQTLSLDLSGYSFAVIQTKIVANSFYYINSIIRINGYDNIVLGRVNNGAEIRSRLLTVRTNNIQFYNAYTGTTLDNASMIPFRIWGL